MKACWNSIKKIKRQRNRPSFIWNKKNRELANFIIWSLCALSAMWSVFFGQRHKVGFKKHMCVLKQSSSNDGKKRVTKCGLEFLSLKALKQKIKACCWDLLRLTLYSQLTETSENSQTLTSRQTKSKRLVNSQNLDNWLCVCLTCN